MASRLKATIAGRFHGFAAKCLNSYIVLYNLAGHAKGGIDGKVEILDKFIKAAECGTGCRSLARRPAIPTVFLRILQHFFKT